MPDPKHEQLRRLFDRALELPAAKRAAFLESKCADDAALKQRIVAMLAAAEDERFLSAPTGSAPAASDPDSIVELATLAPLREGPGSHIGPYKLLQQIGEGGFGVVFMAEQEKPVARRVALKIIKLGMDTRQVVARFEQERQALALMEHPNIARVLDAGAPETGRPYFVMELVKGAPIAEYCDKNNLTIEERLELFEQVCSAVQHAHQKGIIHRDIKPSNVLVGTHDGRPLAKVIDFGVAKATSAKLTERTLFTEHQQVIGTLQYMSPEQAEGSLDIDTRTDVYSLGVLLYELLTGSTPFDQKTIKDALYGELQRMIREVEPPKPSTRLSDSHDTLASIAAHRRVEPKRLGTILRGDLDWIVMKALEKDRARRYETANGLALDIRRHLSGEAVVAAPPSASYRLRKFVRRNKGMVGAVAAVALVLLIGVVASTWFAIVAEEQRRLAVVSRSAEAEQHKLADVQRDRAISAESQAKKRADELKQVAEFQAQMLSAIDATDAGSHLMLDIREKFAAALAKSGVPDAERAPRSTTFGNELELVNATDTAAEMLDRIVLKPAVDAIENQFKDQPLVDASLRQTLASLYEGLGRLDDAYALQTRALATYRLTLGEEHADTLDSRNNLNSILVLKGQSREAESSARETLSTARRVLGDEAQETLTASHNLGQILLGTGQLAEAETTLREVTEIRRRVLGEEHEATLAALNDLGQVLMTENKLPEAESCFREDLAKLRHTLGNEHRKTLRALGNLGSVLHLAGRLEEAEACLRETLQIRRRILGELHPGTINALNNLGTILQDEHKLGEAETCLREAVEKSRRVLGAERPPTFSAMSSLASTLLGQGKSAEVVTLLAPIEASARKVFVGDVAWRGGLILTKLGAAYDDQGEFTKAETYLLESHSIVSKTRGESHPFTRDVMSAIVNLYTHWQAVEPGHGHDAKAAEWKAKLDALPKPAATAGSGK